VDTAELAAIAIDRRVQRSFAFLDLCGFTDYVDDAGDEAAVLELQNLRATVREITPMFGVRVEKWLGDGVMLVAVEPEPLVAAALAIELRHQKLGDLPIRGGIAAGGVLLLEGDDYIGRAVNLASRLCDTARPGQLLAATDGLELPEWVVADEHPPVLVRGMAEPVPVVSLAPDDAELRRRSRGRSATALLAVLESLTRPVRHRRFV
jgi:class 3 adenylate cyclase